jgi:hypothetical protein
MQRSQGSRNGLKTPHAAPLVRGWFHPDILADIVECVPPGVIENVCSVVAEHNFDGSPDLVMYRPKELLFVEVKSQNDTLSEKQKTMMSMLSRISGVQCRLCCPKSAFIKFSRVFKLDDGGDTTDYD